MKSNPKMLLIFWVMVGVLSMGLNLVIAQSSGERPERPRVGEEMQPLTDAQVAQVKAILSQYDKETLTAADAKAIHDAFREAKLPGGAAMNKATSAAGFDPEKLRDLDPPPDRPENGKSSAGNGRPEQGMRYSTKQAISDKAQLATIAFDGLAFLTGDLGGNTFLPPGKVSDFFGFQYMRDIDTGELGHNTSFVPRISNNILYILNDDQEKQLVTLAYAQEKLLEEFALTRFPLIEAFYRLRENDIPAGSSGLDKAAVKDYCAEMYQLDGLLSYQRAEVLGRIIRSLDQAQKDSLRKLAFNNSATWLEKPEQIDKSSMPHDVHVAITTYASEMFSWYAGSIDADIYFCPERHGTYFGSFYMKDIPAMGNPDFSISTKLTGNSGETFLEVLNDKQRQSITSLVEIQRPLLNEIVKTRQAISKQLRQFMKEEVVDKETVLSLSRRYGELDGEISYHYATHFAEVYAALTSKQHKALNKLRNLDDYNCTGAYLYSRSIEMPEIANTDFLFSNVHGNPEDSDTLKFILKSPAIQDGQLLDQYKCEEKVDGTEKSIPLSWENVPVGSKSLAIVMYHFPHKDDHTEVNSYLLLWGIDPAVSEIPYGFADKGKWYMGANKDGNVVSYTSPCSRGGGRHEYIITLFALAEKPFGLPESSTLDVTYEDFVDAIKNTDIIDQATLTFLAISNHTGDRPAPPARPGEKPGNNGNKPQHD